MRYARMGIIFAALVALSLTGCYTKFYRPGMERVSQSGPFDQLYNPNDSSAIDTTLTEPDWQASGDSYYPQYDNWSYWGRPRGYTRWGFDFNRFDPGYYWSYYGYYDYYGRPWWDTWWYDPWYYRPGVPAAPGEPPSKRPPRRSHDSSGGTAGGSYVAPPPPTSIAQPSAGSPPPASQPNNKPKEDDQKRPPKRGR